MTQPINTSAALIMSLYTFVWGLYVANPFWEVFDSAPVYSTLDKLAPEWFWGCFAIAVGFSMTIGIIRHTYKTLTHAAFGGFLHWAIISLGYFAGDWQNTGGLTAFMVAFYCGFVYLNLQVNKDNIRFN
jgi:hypothetical protein